MHDKNGKPIKQGDKVIVQGIIEQTNASETWCNVTIGIGKDQENSEYNVHGVVTLNAKQVELIEPILDATEEEKEFLMQFFEYDHLKPHLQSVSKPFGELAKLIMRLPRNPERTVALRKLLEGKDCAVRALIAK